MAERSIHMMVSGNWASVPKDLLSYLEEEVGGDPAENPVATAFSLIRIGVSPEKAVALLDWKKFEDLCVQGLQISGMDTISRVRFSLRGRRFEVDVLGLNEGLVLVVDCKMWSKGSHPKASKLKEAAHKQLERVRALDEALRKGGVKRLEVIEGKSVMVPTLVTWLDFGIRLSDEGVPIVPLLSLPSFLDQVYELIDDLAHLKIDYRVKIRVRDRSQP